MTDKPIPIVQLDDHKTRNWKLHAGPVAMLNPESTIHERIAYCHGLTVNLEAIAYLGDTSGDGDVARFASLINSVLVPLLATLENLGDITAKADGGISIEGAP